MWTNLSNNLPLTLLGSILLALPACFWLGRAAYALPREIDANLPVQPPASHNLSKRIFLLAGSFIAPAFSLFFGSSPAAIASTGFILVLLALAWIDAETGYLPDKLTLPLLWAGLLVNLNDTFVPLEHAVIGAAGGYVFLWLVYRVFWLFTRREGMGFGDFKLVAALGAWLGWISLPWLLLVATATSLAVLLVQRLLPGKREITGMIRFGPYLALAGIAGMLGIWL